MKKLISFLVFAALAFAAEPSAAVKSKVEAAQKAWVEATVKGDKAALDKLLSNDLLYVHSSGKAETKSEFIEAITKGTTTYESIEFSGGSLRQYGNTVVQHTKANIKTKQSGVAKLDLVQVWVKEGSAWKLAVRHAARPPQQ